MHPELGYLVNRSAQGEVEFLQEQKKCEEMLRNFSFESDYEHLSPEEKKAFDDCLLEHEGYWDVMGIGCSWYCGGGQDTLSASSELQAQKGISYAPRNIHDLNYQTAWVEGVPGDGIGEFVTYHVPPYNPRITEIIVANGYLKSEKAWRENSRVKKLKMYIDDTAVAILNLEDTRQEQHFTFEPLGYADRENWDQLNEKPWWTLKFEILAVYPGDKYDDTAITEIYFDGIDVH